MAQYSNTFVLLLIAVCVNFCLAYPYNYFEWVGGAACQTAQNPPCDFDDPAFWNGISGAKRDSSEVLGVSNVSPAFQSEPYDIYFPSGFANTNYYIQANNASGYNVSKIFIQNGLVKRGAEATQGAPDGMILTFKDTKLTNFGLYSLGGQAASHQLIFDNVEIIQTADVSEHTQYGYSTVRFTGKTVATFKAPAYFRDYDSFIIDKDAVVSYQGVASIRPQSGDVQGQYLEIFGKLLIDTDSYFQANPESGTNTFTGANITFRNPQAPSGVLNFNVKSFIGFGANDNGKVTHINVPVQWYQTTLTISAKTISYIALTELLFSKAVVEDESTVHVIDHQLENYSRIFRLAQNSNLEVKGNSNVYIETNVTTDQVIGKRSLQEGTPFYNFTVYDGLLQFEGSVQARRQNTYFILKSASSVLRFNNDLTELSNSLTNFEAVAGSTIIFNKKALFINLLPSSGVNIEFGDSTYPYFSTLSMTNSGSITLKGSSMSNVDFTIENSTFSGYGTTGDIALSDSSKIALSSVGNTLTVDGKITIPSGSIISITATSSSCGKLVAGTLDISSNATFEVVFSGSPPTQSTTYTVAEYTTLTGTLPPSPDSSVFEIEHDTQAKTIKVIYAPSVPTTPPINSPTGSPTSEPTGTPSTASIFQFSAFVLLFVVIALFMQL